MLRHFRTAFPPDRFDAALRSIFGASTSLGFLTYLLRDETFGHGFYGDRPNATDRLTSREGFDDIRAIMIARYSASGLDTVLTEKRATDILYAWSQAGGRDDIIERVAARSSNDSWLVNFVKLLYSSKSSLSLDALTNFFVSPAAIMQRILMLSKHGSEYEYLQALDIVRSIEANIRFDGGDFEKILKAWEMGEQKNSGAEPSSDTTGP